MEKLITFAIPSYNSGAFMHKCIDSLLHSEADDIEIIIVNDGSKDNSENIVRNYCDTDSRIKLFNQKNAGSAAARNNGIRRAQGRYIALLDADDLWEPFFLESQLALMREHNALLVYGAHKRIDANNNECLTPFIPPQRITYTDLLKTCSITCLTGLYDTSKYGKVYLHEEFRSLRDDYIYWLEIIKQTGEAWGNQNIIGSYRILGNSVSRNKKKVIKPQFLVYYKVEKLGLIRSFFYLAHWAINGFLKYRK